MQEERKLDQLKQKWFLNSSKCLSANSNGALSLQEVFSKGTSSCFLSENYCNDFAEILPFRIGFGTLQNFQICWASQIIEILKRNKSCGWHKTERNIFGQKMKPCLTKILFYIWVKKETNCIPQLDFLLALELDGLNTGCQLKIVWFEGSPKLVSRTSCVPSLLETILSELVSKSFISACNGLFIANKVSNLLVSLNWLNFHLHEDNFHYVDNLFSSWTTSWTFQ